jgi:hypothetical protein
LHSPYTEHYELAAAIGLGCTGVALAGLAGAMPLPRPSRDWARAAVSAAAVVPVITLIGGEGLTQVVGVALLHLALLGATVAVFFARRRALLWAALSGHVLLEWLVIPLAPAHVAAGLELAWIAGLVGLMARTSGSGASESPGAPLLRAGVADARLCALAIAVASVVCVVVFGAFPNTGDEWAYTFQADLFAHFRAYAPEPPCAEASRAYWVFDYGGRRFAEYTPGWPLFMAPFSRIGLAWLAGPVALGFAALGVARLARRASVGAGDGARTSSMAGAVAAVTMTSSAAVAMTAASRYAHVFVLCAWIWSIEASCVLTGEGGLPRPTGRRAWAWGAVAGSGLALAAATRPQDGFLLDAAVVVFLIQAAIRRRISWAGLAVAVGSGLAWCALVLIILRVQIGAWFVVGYQISPTIHGGAPWGTLHMSVPTRAEMAMALPLATGSYCWWPCAPALGTLGLVGARRNWAGLALMLAAGGLGTFLFYMTVEYARSWEWGYGPRYYLAAIAPMAVGGALPLARAWTSAPQRLRVMLAAPVVAGTLVLAPLLYPHLRDEVQRNSAVARAIAREHPPDAVVLVPQGGAFGDARDLVQNLPSDDHPQVLILREGQTDSCVRDAYRDRAFYRAVPDGESDVRLELLR